MMDLSAYNTQMAQFNPYLQYQQAARRRTGAAGGTGASSSGMIPATQTTGGTSGSAVGTQTTGGGGGGWAPPSEWGARNLWSQGSGEYDPSEFAWGGSTPQSWWRSPDMAGGIVYNDQYGWQEADPVREWYRQFQAAPTAEQFGGAGWTPQGVGTTDVGSWRDYYPDRDTDAGWAARGYGWNQEAGQWEQGYSGQGGGNDLMEYTPYGVDSNVAIGTGGTSGAYPTADTSGYTGEYTPFPFSPDLYQASNVLGNFSATGGETQAPPEWALSGDIAARMGMTGMPVDQSASYQAQKAVAQQNIQDEIDQAAERANLTGLRWSTPLGRSAQETAGKYMTQLGASTTAQEAAAQEAARQRQLTGASQLYGVGQGYAGLQENAASRALQAAGMLPQTAAMYTNLPMSVAESSYNMGTGNQNLANQQIQAYYAEQQRLMEENNPWLQYAASATQLPFQMAQQQYNPSFLSQILGAAGGALPFINFGGSSGGTTMAGSPYSSGGGYYA